MTTVPPTRSAVDALAVASTMSPSDRATAGGLSPLPASLSTLVDNPPRDGIECASISTFVDTWVSAPVRVIAPRIDYGPQYNGVGECPF